MAEKKISEKLKKFCEYYATSGNASEAALKAGYSKKNVGPNAGKTLKNPKVIKYLAELDKKIRSEAIADVTEVKEFWSGILRSEDEEMPHKLKASELLVKSQGGFLDKVEHSGKVQVEKIERKIIDPSN